MIRALCDLTARERVVLIIALIIGLAERVGWAVVRPNGSATGEAYNVAVAIASGRGFADAFAVGQGPTAHLLPLPPLFAGGVYRVLGVGSTPAEAVLLGWSLLLTFATYALFSLIARQLGLPRRACIGAFAFLCVAPLFTSVEAFDFRAWEGGMTMSAAGAFLWLLLREDAGERVPAWALGALPALLLFLQPIVGLAACSAWAVASWGRSRRARAMPALATFAVVAAALFGSWTARNIAVMHEPIWLRDNLGLELAVANHPGAVAPADPAAAFQARLAEVHPMVGADAYAALVAAGGEPAYARLLGRRTLAWMRANPGSVARLWLGHLRQIILPAPWQFQTAHGRVLPLVRALMFNVVAVAGLLGLALLARDRGRRALILAPFIVLPIMAYVPFQPILRYIWLVYVPLTYMAAYAMMVGFRQWLPE